MLRAPCSSPLRREPACGARDGEAPVLTPTHRQPDRRHAGQRTGQQAWQDAEADILGDRRGHVPVPHSHPRSTGRARILGPSVVSHRTGLTPASDDELANIKTHHGVMSQ